MDENKISYIGVKAMIVNNGGNVLIIQESNRFAGGGKWELPGGKIDNGEEGTPLEEILRREMREELGEDFRLQIMGIIDVMRRPWNKPGASADQVMLVVFECLYESGDIRLSHESDNFAWVTAKELSRYEFVPGYLPVLEKYFSK